MTEVDAASRSDAALADIRQGEERIRQGTRDAAEDPFEEAITRDAEREAQLEAEGLSDPAAEAADAARRAEDKARTEQGVAEAARVVGRQSIDEIVRSGRDPSRAIFERIPQLQDPKLVDEGLRIFDELLQSNEGFIRIRLGGNPRKLSREAKALIGLSEGSVLSLENLVADNPDGLRLVAALTRMLDEQGVKLRTGRESEAEQIQAALAHVQDLRGGSVEDAMGFFSQVTSKAEEIAHASLALDIYISSASSRVLKLIEIQRKGLENASPADIAAAGLADALADGDRGLQAVLLDEMQRVSAAVAALSRTSSATGRALRSRQIPVFPELADGVKGVEDLDVLRETLGEKEFNRRMGMLEALGNGTRLEQKAALMKFREMTTLQKLSFITTDWTIQNLLWAPKTLFTNAIFPLMHSMLLPIEGVMGGLLTGNGSIIRKELNSMMAMPMALVDAGKAFQTSLKHGPQFDPKYLTRDDGRTLTAVSSEVAGEVLGESWGPGTIVGNMIDVLGKAHQVPTVFMNASDDAVKVFTARSSAYGMLTEQALKKGVDPTTYVSENLPRLFDNGQLLSREKLERDVDALLQAEGLTDPAQIAQRRGEIARELRDQANFDELNPVSAELLRRGREVTATTPLEPGSLPANIQTTVDQLPFGRLFLPFIRTPSNLINSAVSRSPLGMFPPIFRKVLGQTDARSIEASRSRNVRELFSEDPNLRSQAVGRMSTGVGVTLTVGAYANAGVITGAGPQDKETRQLLLDAGWLPYSIRVGKGKYVQYLKGDPLSIMIGLTADTVESAHMMVADEHSSDTEAIMLGLINSVANNLTDRSYLAGIQSLLNTLSDPSRHAGNFVGQLAGGLVPRGISEVIRLSRDPVLKDAHNIVTRVKRTLPMFGDLPPIRNMFGEPIRSSGALGADKDNPAAYLYDLIIPVAYREVNDPIRHELAALKHGFSPPERSRYGLFLPDYLRGKQDAYDRWGELQGKVRINGRTIRQEMKRLIRSEEYKRLPLDATFHDESPRVGLIKKVISRYRAAAWDQLLDEYPTLARDVGRRQVDQKRLKAGLIPASQREGVIPPFGAFLPGGLNDPQLQTGSTSFVE